jgi:hypothetical protein
MPVIVAGRESTFSIVSVMSCALPGVHADSRP